MTDTLPAAGPGLTMPPPVVCWANDNPYGGRCARTARNDIGLCDVHLRELREDS